ncbi:MAG: hypothetical protein AAFU77_03360 [Myxococcota bacterium]
MTAVSGDLALAKQLNRFHRTLDAQTDELLRQAGETNEILDRIDRQVPGSRADGRQKLNGFVAPGRELLEQAVPEVPVGSHRHLETLEHALHVARGHLCGAIQGLEVATEQLRRTLEQRPRSRDPL